MVLHVTVHSREKKGVAEHLGRYLESLFGRGLFELSEVVEAYPEQVCVNDLVETLGSYAGSEFNVFLVKEMRVREPYFQYGFMERWKVRTLRGGSYSQGIAVVYDGYPDEKVAKLAVHELIAEMGWNFNRRLGVGHDRYGVYDCILSHRGDPGVKLCDKCSVLASHGEELASYLKEKGKKYLRERQFRKTT